MMKLGTGTGSLINHLHSRSASPAPVVGMGITFLHWTDRSCGHVVAVLDGGKRIEVVGAKVTWQPHPSGCPEKIEPGDPNGPRATYRLVRGKWRRYVRNPMTNRWNMQNGPTPVLGTCDPYHDPHF